VLLRDGDAQEPGLAHLAEDAGVGGLLVVGLLDAGGEAAFRELPGGVAEHPFVLGQLVLQAEGIGPVEGGQAGAVTRGFGSDPDGLVHGLSPSWGGVRVGPWDGRRNGARTPSIGRVFLTKITESLTERRGVDDGSGDRRRVGTLRHF
jgi:hypothetical protein